MLSPTEVFRGFLSDFRQPLKQHLGLGHDRFLPYPFQIIYPTFRRCLVQLLRKLVKQPTKNNYVIFNFEDNSI